MDMIREGCALAAVSGLRADIRNEAAFGPVAWQDTSCGIAYLAPNTRLRFEYWMCKVLFGSSAVTVAAADLAAERVTGFRFAEDPPAATQETAQEISVGCRLLRCAQSGRRLLARDSADAQGPAFPGGQDPAPGVALDAAQLRLIVEAGLLDGDARAQGADPPAPDQRIDRPRKRA